MLILEPKSAFATMLVTLKPSSFIFLFVSFLISLAIFEAAICASSSDSDPMIIILPDLKIRIVLLGLVFLSITAGNLFLLYLEPDTFSAINFNSSSALFYVSSRANETTFCTTGSTLLFWDIFIMFLVCFRYIKLRHFVHLWVSKLLKPKLKQYY